MKYTEITLPSNRKFGFFFSFIFLLFFFYLQNSIFGYVMIVMSITTLSITIIKAEILRPLNKVWMKFGFLLGYFISPIIMGIIYFFIFTPTAIFLSIFKRDELDLKNLNKKSNWKERGKNKYDENEFKNQF